MNYRRTPKEWPFVPAGSFELMIGQGGDLSDPTGCQIRVSDAASGLVVINIRLSYLALMEAFRGRHHGADAQATYRINRSPNVERRHEVKREQIPLPDEVTYRTHRYREDEAYEEDAARVYQYLTDKGYCVDGWEPSVDDVFNHHNRKGYDPTWEDKHGKLLPFWALYSITFHRYVAPDDAPAT